MRKKIKDIIPTKGTTLIFEGEAPLTESMNTDTDDDNVSADYYANELAYCKQAEATISDHKVFISASPISGEYHIEFSVDYGYGSTMDVVNNSSGHFQILSFVFNVIVKWIDIVKPKVFLFTSDDRAREKVYDKFASYLENKFSGYGCSLRRERNDTLVYKFSKKDVSNVVESKPILIGDLIEESMNTETDDDGRTADSVATELARQLNVSGAIREAYYQGKIGGVSVWLTIARLITDYDISFKTKEGDSDEKWTDKITNKGVAHFRIISFIANVIDKLIDIVEPMSFHFSVIYLQESRVKLYDKFATYLAQKHNEYVFEKERDNILYRYYFQKKFE